MIRNKLGIDDPVAYNNTHIAYQIYTDGSFDKGKRNIAKCGWGFVVFGRGMQPDRDTEVLKEAFGPTVIDRGTKYFIGAGKKSNNTAELSAFIEAMLYILGQRGEDSCFDIVSTGTLVKV